MKILNFILMINLIIEIMYGFCEDNKWYPFDLENEFLSKYWESAVI